MRTPTAILESAYEDAIRDTSKVWVTDAQIRARVDFLCRCLPNRAGVRLLMAALLAKLHRPDVDVRKPYTEIGGMDSYSGRHYDEAYVGAFVHQHELPCNPTTAFLTPAFRNRNVILTPDLNMVGRPARMYLDLLHLLSDVHEGHVSPYDLLVETIRGLLLVRDEKRERMKALMAGLHVTQDAPPLSAEQTVTLIEQHLAVKGASRLPVIIVAAAYRTVELRLGEHVLPLKAHNAADRQTGAIGDVEITLVGDDRVVTTYEMKRKRVIAEDIDLALAKVQASGKHIDNYIFVTTDVIDESVRRYAASIYEKTGGLEIVVLDCVAFLRHFLHLFHRLRTVFLDTYQRLMLEEPDSAVSQPVKEAFLALRLAAESGESDPEDSTSG